MEFIEVWRDQLAQKQFWLENELLEKIYYKNKNQHQPTKYFQKLTHVIFSFFSKIKINKNNHDLGQKNFKKVIQG